MMSGPLHCHPSILPSLNTQLCRLLMAAAQFSHNLEVTELYCCPESVGC